MSSALFCCSELTRGPETQIAFSSTATRAKQAGALRKGGGQRTTHGKSIQNVLQTGSAVNGVLLQEKKVPLKRRAAWLSRPFAENL
jgi:hypothetical protein